MDLDYHHGMESVDELEKRFFSTVNMTAGEIRRFLATDESKKVGFTYAGERESVGRQSARKIIRFLEHGAHSEADHKHMRKVLGYIARHMAQRPHGDVTNTPWRWSLMNWGFDPLKGGYRVKYRARRPTHKKRRHW